MQKVIVQILAEQASGLRRYRIRITSPQDRRSSALRFYSDERGLCEILSQLDISPDDCKRHAGKAVLSAKNQTRLAQVYTFTTEARDIGCDSLGLK